VVGQLQNFAAMYSSIQSYLLLKRNPRHLIAAFKSEIMSFYIYLRPKLLDICKKRDPKVETYKNLIRYVDQFIDKPSVLPLGKAITIYVLLNQFCHDYNLTDTTYFDHVEGDTY